MAETKIVTLMWFSVYKEEIFKTITLYMVDKGK